MYLSTIFYKLLIFIIKSIFNDNHLIQVEFLFTNWINTINIIIKIKIAMEKYNEQINMYSSIKNFSKTFVLLQIL